MQEKISALLDGELDHDQAASVLAALDQDDELQDNWHLYHLIGDVLRDSNQANVSITNKVATRLNEEPALTVTHQTSVTKHPPREAANKAWYSVAASLAGIAFVGWVAWQSFSPATTKPAGISANLAQQMQTSPTVKPVAYESRVNDYWLAHRQLSGHMTNSQDQQVQFVTVQTPGEGR